ncbi:type II secretion system F family protein [Ferrimonas lipolytica]|uniref:Type II secretion system F family protein n=1 Tax=Ferrimonas lipolytica TaxID=2724191 RepID=A0A6H1UH38_9GAMM|nr:type II secretion system F family protein [Ferrimonas lipolytica]QIZ77920.1 type II secretion system F family protein [Ferrimonas lipolytica]
MPQYQYQGRGPGGNKVDGTLEANSESAAMEQLMRRSIIPLELKPISERKGLEFKALFQSKIPTTALLLFTRQMQSLAKSGIPLLQALTGLAEGQDNELMKETLLDLRDQLVQGHPLSAAMNQHPRVFSAMYVAMIHVGENTGNLDEAFGRLHQHIEQDSETKRQVKAAMRYPTIVVAVIAVAMVVLNIFVIPQFASMFAKFGAELPLPTRILIGTSDFFVNYWWLLTIGVIAAFFGIRAYLLSAAGAYNWDKFKLRMPLLGSLIRRATLSRFSRSLAMMLRGGVPIHQSLQLVSEAVDNTYMQQSIVTMRRGIEGGDSLQRVAGQSGLFTALVMQMISVGEETGRLDELLDDAAEFYDREVEHELKGLTAKLEPILLVIVACMLAVLALGIYLPMWDMFSAVQGH